MGRKLLWLIALGGALAGIALAGGSTSRAEGPNAVLDLPGCTANTLADNDDSSTGLVPIGFTIDFFGATYDSLYVNNNGNVTFDHPLSTYIAFDLTSATHPMIAPFFGDVDTRSRSNGALDVTYGQTTYNGRAAFCVNWVNVGEYSERYGSPTSAQLLLVDAGSGNFDMMLNYDKVGWDHGGNVGIGYTNGSGDVNTFYELPGSRQANVLLDSSPTGLVHSNLNTSQLGRYVFPVRGGSLPIGGSIGGSVTLAAGGAPVGAGAPVQVCPTAAGRCRISVTNANGGYNVSGLPAGTYNVTVSAPPSSALMPATGGPVTVTPPGPSTLNLQMTGPTPPPPGTTITSIGNNGGIPTVYWNDALTLTTTGCAGATATFQIISNGVVARSGTMSEPTPGGYVGHAAALYPTHGAAQVTFTIVCPGGATTTPGFNIYIDPSGTVIDTTGAPVVGARVTLLRSDFNTGPFTAVPSGDAIMSPANRTNPDTSDATGNFGWDVLAGFYVVRAEKTGCRSPDDPSVSFVETAVLDIPPPVTNLVLTLECATATHPLLPPREKVVDMGISQTIDPSTVHVGETALVTLGATDHGLDPATQVAISDELPDGLTVVGTDAGGGTCGVENRLLTCTRSKLDTGATWTVALRVQANAAGAFTLRSGTSAREADPNVGDNNYSDAVLTAIAAPNVTAGEPGAFAPPLQVIRKHGAVNVIGVVQVDTAAKLTISIADGSGKALSLLAGTAAGGGAGAGAALVTDVQPGATALFLRLAPKAAVKGKQYTVTVAAANEAGSNTLTLHFVG
jgi:uncharacterized repeat protein (TIGR01451 family)